MLLELLQLVHGRRKPRLPPKHRLKEGEKICGLCRGTGNLGYPGGSRWPLSCHRCDDGVVWPRFERAAQDWEYFCGKNSYSGKRKTIKQLNAYMAENDKVYGEYKAAKAEWHETRLNNLWIHEESCPANRKYAKKVERDCTCDITK